MALCFKSARTMTLFMAIFWTAIVSVFVAWDAYGITGQLSTRSFAGTQGWVDRISVSTNSDTDGDTYGIDIAYHYYINHVRFNATRIRYGQASSGDNWADHFAQSHPVNSSMTVYYDPANPSRAVLVRGLEGFDLVSAMFLTPFVCVGIGLWWFVFSGRRKSGLAGLRVTERPDFIRLRPGYASVVISFLTALLLGSFAGTFILVFGTGFHPFYRLAALSWDAILTCAGVTACVSFIRLIAGRRDMYLDLNAKTLRIRGKRKIPFADLHRIDVVASKGANDSNIITYNVQLRYGNNRTINLRGRPTLLEPARRLAAYLVLWLGIQAFDHSGAPLTQESVRAR